MLSLCIIVKDEEAFLGECLTSFYHVAGEMIVIDTGSTDRTKEIAQALGARVLDFSWVDDFSAARNYALEQAKGDWIIMPDADDVLDDGQKLPECLADKETWGYRIPIRHYSNDKKAHNWHPMPQKMRGFSGFLLTKAIKLFQNRKEIRYRFSVHESVRFSIEEHKGTIRDAPFIFHHYGSLRGNAIKKGKHDYYLSLSLKDCQKYGHHPKPFYEAGTAYFEKGMLEEAEKAFSRMPQNPHYMMTDFYLGEIAYARKDLQKAKHFMLENIQRHPSHAESCFSLGKILTWLNEDPRPALQRAVRLQKNVRYYEALINAHLYRNELFPALALLYDVTGLTDDHSLYEKRQKIEQYLKENAEQRLRLGPDELAYIWLATIALFQKDKEKVISICEEAQGPYPQSAALLAIRQKCQKIFPGHG